jgi:hypothetical protein
VFLYICRSFVICLYSDYSIYSNVFIIGPFFFKCNMSIVFSMVFICVLCLICVLNIWNLVCCIV